MKNYIVFILLFVLFVSCNNKEKIAQQNFKQYITERSLPGTKLSFEKFSRLYIIYPKDISKIPAPDTTRFENEFGDILSLYSSGLYLTLGGCTPKILQTVIENDKKFRTWGTGGEEFAMVCLLTGQDKYLNEYTIGLCAKLDSNLNITRTYQISEINAVRRIIDED